MLGGGGEGGGDAWHFGSNWWFGILDTRQNKFSWLWGIYIPQDGILLFSGRSSGIAINRYTRYGNPQGCPSDTHKVKISNCTPRRKSKSNSNLDLGQIYLNTGFFTRFSNSHPGREGKSSQSTATWYELRQILQESSRE